MLNTLMAVALILTPQGYRPSFDPSHAKPAVIPANEVVVLGTPHLSEIPDQVYPSSFEPLLDRLAGFRPDIITVEDLSGVQCAFLRAFPARWTDTVKTYCWDPAPARAATGLDVPAAAAEAERLLATLGSTPAPSQRRRLAAVLLASGELTSALVQWLRLPKPERRTGDSLDADLVDLLKNLALQHNEASAIAAPLAARLGLERVYATDDHTSDFTVADEPGFEAAMKRIWSNPAVQRRRAVDERLIAGLRGPDGVLALYRGINNPATFPLIDKSDFGAALLDRSPGRFGRRYVGGWETRNLRMVSNIRDALTAAPGSRLLTIVGVSHKPYFEAYLSQMRDVRLTNLATVLR